MRASSEDSSMGHCVRRQRSRDQQWQRYLKATAKPGKRTTPICHVIEAETNLDSPQSIRKHGWDERKAANPAGYIFAIVPVLPECEVKPSTSPDLNGTSERLASLKRTSKNSRKTFFSLSRWVSLCGLLLPSQLYESLAVISGCRLTPVVHPIAVASPVA